MSPPAGFDLLCELGISNRPHEVGGPFVYVG